VPAAAEADLFVGPIDRPDEYELTDRGRKGGEGIVFRARYQGALPRPIEFAVKQLVPPLGKSPLEWPGAALVERWNEQLKLLHLLHHDHLVGYHELFYGWPPHPAGSCTAVPPRQLGTWYLTMLWVDGPNLHDVTRAGTATLSERLGCIADLAAAVAHLHSGAQTSGMVVLHRDIKPGNVIVTSAHGAVLVDCGLLRVEEPQLTEVPAWTGPYLAPEVHIDKTRTSRASDLWAVAATGFFAVTGEHPSPFAPDRMRQQLEEVLSGAVARPDELTDVFMSALDLTPEGRPPGLGAWAALLSAALGPPAPPGTPSPQQPGLGPGDAVARSAEPVVAPPSPALAPNWRSPRRVVALVAAALLLAGAVVAGIRLEEGSSTPKPRSPTTGVTTPGTTSPPATTGVTAPGTTSPSATTGVTAAGATVPSATTGAGTTSAGGH
jgi:serine/threonine-protein kinase